MGEYTHTHKLKGSLLVLREVGEPEDAAQLFN